MFSSILSCNTVLQVKNCGLNSKKGNEAAEEKSSGNLPNREIKRKERLITKIMTR